MARRITPNLVPTGLFLGAAARVRIPAAHKIDGVRFPGDVRRILNDLVREALAAHKDADRQLVIKSELAAPMREKLAKFEASRGRAIAAGGREETVELATELIEALRAKIAPIDAEIAEILASKITECEIAAAIEVAHARTSSGTEWANAAKVMLESPTVDLRDQRNVGCLSRAAARN